MTENLIYKGRILGSLKTDSTGRMIFVAENLQCLVELFKIPPENEIETDFSGKIAYKEFFNKTLKKVSGFYPTINDWLFKKERERILTHSESRNPRY